MLDLNDALQKPGCPICNIETTAEQRYMRYFLHEYVNDMGTRLRLQGSWGFCQEHAWRLQAIELYSYEDGLKNAIIYEWMLDRAINTTKKVKGRLRNKTNKPTLGFWSKPEPITKVYQKTNLCPVCYVVMDSKDYNLELLVKNLADDRFLASYKASDGLCLRHFVQALELSAEESLLEILCDLQIDRMTRIYKELNGYINKHDYKNESPYTAAEQKA
jgi:hypothetical protein